MQSKAATVEQYLAELPEDRRAVVQQVREMILKNLGKGFEEGMQYGMIGYYVPHRLYPAGYHCDPRQPLPFAGLASQKRHLSLYLMSMYDANMECRSFVEAWRKTGRKLDMGKSCIRFKKAEDLAMDLLGDSIRRMPVKKWIEYYETTFRNHRRKTGKSAPAETTKPVTKAKRTRKSRAGAAR